MSTSNRVLDALGITHTGDGIGQYRCNAPYRSGSDSNSLALTIHGGEHGQWYDHVEKTGGSLYSLAERLGVMIDGNLQRRIMTLADYAQSHGLTAEDLAKYGWEESFVTVNKRRYSALKFPTATGPRWRILDPACDIKYLHGKGYKASWFRLQEALFLAQKHSQPLVLCNGEISVISAQHWGVAATCLSGGGERNIPADLLPGLAQYQGEILVAMDCDDTGKRAGINLGIQLRNAGHNVRVVNLALGHKGDISDFVSLHQDKAREGLAQCEVYSEEELAMQWKNIGILASDLQQYERRPPRWIVPGILTQGACLLAGAPKSRKSWLAAQIAWSVASGTTLFGPDIQCEQGDVLYLDLEMMRDNTASRFDAMSERDQVWPKRLRVVTIEDDWPRGDEGLAMIEAWCIDHPQRALVIIDILANMRPQRQKGENLYEEDLAFTQSVNKLAEKYRIAVIGVVHTRKMTDIHKANTISGTTGMTGGVAMSMVLTKNPADDAMNELYREGRHLINSEPLALKWNGYHARHILEGPVMEVALSMERKRLLSIMDNGEAWSVKDLATEMQKSDSTVHAMLQWLLSQALIEKVGRGKYALRRRKEWLQTLLDVTTPDGNTTSNGNYGNDGNDGKGIEQGEGISIISENLQKGDGNGAGHSTALNEVKNDHFRNFHKYACIQCPAPNPLGVLGWYWRNDDDPIWATLSADIAGAIQHIRDTNPDDAREAVTAITDRLGLKYLSLFIRKED